MGNEGCKLSPKQLEDLQNNTAFDGTEISEWYKRFQDNCPEGEMGREEFHKLYCKLFPEGDPTEFAEHVFKAYDKDGNGKIDFREFLCTISVASRGCIDEKLRWAFNMYDLDGNGYVTKEEVTFIVQAIFKMRGVAGVRMGGDKKLSAAQAVEKIFERLDKDNDKKLTDMEFIVGAKMDPEILCILQNGQ